MKITKNLGNNQIRKVALLITKASELGMDLSGYGEASENDTSGNVYLWLEDYSFTLYIGLGSDTIYANWTSLYDGEEENIEVEGLFLNDLIAWADKLNEQAEEKELA